MVRIVGMIPARLGSKRVPKKNLRLLNGKPLIAYTIEAALASKVFDEIYINSEAEIFAEIAEQHGIKFYKRPEHLASDATINDEFAHNFIQNTEGDILVQLLPTSPLIAPEEIKKFVAEMLAQNYDTLVSVASHQIASIYKNKPINFDMHEPHKSSQTMTPVQSYATVLMAWKYENFLNNMQKHGCAYHGASGKIGYFPLGGLTTIDIDNEEDFALAEVALKYRASQQEHKPEYYAPMNKKHTSEVDVPTILKKDGVLASNFENENLPLVKLKEIIDGQDSTKSWCYRVVNTESNSATLISQLPGEGNRLHYHPHWNEWWYILKGKWMWTVEGNEYVVKKGDMVFIEKNKRHKITAMGDEPAIRLAVSRGDVAHVYPGDEQIH